MSITGKYKRIGEQGAKEFLMNEGMSAEAAEHTAKMGLILEFKLDGNKVTRVVAAGNIYDVDEFVLGQTFKEVLLEKEIMTTPTLEGSTLILSSKNEDGSEGWSRYHYFTDSGLEVLHKASHGETRMQFERVL